MTTTVPTNASTLPSKPASFGELKCLILARKIVTPTQVGTVLRFAIEDPYFAAFATVSSLSKSCDVSATTVVRAINYLGFEHFADFRNLFRNHIRSASV